MAHKFTTAMPKEIPETEFDDLIGIVAGFSGGASLEQIAGGLEAGYARRTLQRRLARLVERGALVMEGDRRWSRYRLPTAEPEERLRYAPVERWSARVEEETEVSLSTEARKLRGLVHRPLSQRKAVGYNREFLDGYRPNKEHYLPAEVRRRLAERGRAPAEGLPAGTYAREIFNRILIDLSWNSSRLEGNTYSLLETERLLELGESVDGKDVREAQMILNHKTAIEMLVEQADEIGFNRYTILNLHAALSEDLLREREASGRLRSIAVGISGTSFRPLQGPALIEECFGQFLEKAEAIEDPLEQAFFAMVHLPYLQPFEDVNKRVSRLAANIPLVRGNLCPLSFVGVPDHLYVDGILAVYEENRVELLRDVFVWAYERSCELYAVARGQLGDPDPFRMRYRPLIREIVAEVVRAGLGKQAAADHIRRRIANIAERDRARLLEAVEIDLMALHEGNIARLRLRPAEFRAWRETWR